MVILYEGSGGASEGSGIASDEEILEDGNVGDHWMSASGMETVGGFRSDISFMPQKRR